MAKIHLTVNGIPVIVPEGAMLSAAVSLTRAPHGLVAARITGHASAIPIEPYLPTRTVEDHG